jgi:hypothetical protein
MTSLLWTIGLAVIVALFIAFVAWVWLDIEQID